MRKLRKDERICPICGKIYRIKGKIKNRKKYCSIECHEKAHVEKKRERIERIQRLGTPSTWNLSEKAVKKQLYYIRNNIDYNARAFSSEKTERDIILENAYYDDSFYHEIYIVEEA